MILDSSAIVALMLKEPGYEVLRHKLVAATVVAVGTPTLVETAIVLSSRQGADTRGALARFIDETGVIVMPFTEAHFGLATAAWLKYGKGRHPAALNFGDCLAYAVAKMSDFPLLCVGDDFPQTDLSLA